MDVFLRSVAALGWTCALLFLVLFVFHPSTRRTRKNRGDRVFWLFIMADSSVLLMIYTTAVLNLFFHDWPHKDAFRALLGTCSIFVVVWRLLLFWNLNIRKREADKQRT